MEDIRQWHPTALINSKSIGSGTRIWAFVNILPGAAIGKDCNICDHVFIENDVYLGDRVTVKCGVQLWDGVRIEDDVFVGPNATFCNDSFPRSKQNRSTHLTTIIKRGASIGANATLLPGIEIGAGAVIGAGSVVTSNVPPGAVVVGNPARVTRYADTQSANVQTATQNSTELAGPIHGVKWIDLTEVSDVRGHLTVAQWNQHLPFSPERVFFVHHVPSTKVRGEHAHKQCDQVLLAITGSVTVVTDDGKTRQQFELSSSNRGLLIPAGIWTTQYNHSHDCVLVVFASHSYDESDYLRSYDEYLTHRQI